MRWESFSSDQLEQELAASRAARSRLDAHDIEILEVLDARQVATADGSRSLSEWVAARLDLSSDTARSLVRTMRRTADRPDLRASLASGGVSFDRVEAVSRIRERVGLLEHLDVSGVCREAANRVRITAVEEYRTADDRFLLLQPSLDESWWKLWGGLDGVSGAIVDKVLSETAGQLPALPDGTRGDSSWRRATALVELAVSDDPPPAQVTVFVDAQHAVGSNGQAGVVLEAGPGIGAQALEAILCEAVTEITVTSEDGTPLRYGRQSRTIPPALRRAIIHRDGNRCAADSCDSRHRLQVHHLKPWSKGGPTNPENLITLCWFHHQVVVHQRGLQIFRHPDHGRIRFQKPGPRDPPG
jgi:5-methylcytosine-specific restriction endonuclease McrA